MRQAVAHSFECPSRCGFVAGNHQTHSDQDPTDQKERRNPLMQEQPTQESAHHGLGKKCERRQAGVHVGEGGVPENHGERRANDSQEEHTYHHAESNLSNPCY